MMNGQILLRVDGEVERPMAWTYESLRSVDPSCQIADISSVDAKRQGGAVTLAELLRLSDVRTDADYLTLHASADDFHASVPLAAVLERAYLVYTLDGAPLSAKQGGPTRLLIRDSSACHASEIDECANVKFLDRIELTRGRGEDNRPTTDEDHDALHDH